jgi:stage III sporulation protein AB
MYLVERVKSMIIKLLTSCIIISCCTWMGIQSANRYSQRIKEIRILQHSLSVLETEILHYLTILPEALERIAASTNGILGQFFHNVSEKLINRQDYTVSKAWRNTLEEIKSEISLHQEEIDLLIRFGDNLGISDKEGQHRYFELIQDQLKKQERSAEETRSKYERMYRSLGVLGGLALAIILL